jgi:putative transposase
VSEDRREDEALWRYGLIRELLESSLTPAERGALARALTVSVHRYLDGSLRSVSRSSVDRWVRAYRAGGFRALYPRERQGGARSDAGLLGLAVALKAEAPERTGAQIAEIIARAEDDRAVAEGREPRRLPAARTIQRHLARSGLGGRGASQGGGGRSFRRFEAERPNELWLADCMHGPAVGSRKAILMCIEDDHSRYIPGARFVFVESTVRLEGVLRAAFLAHGLPERLYCDNGQIFSSGRLEQICARLGIALVHSRPRRPEGRGKLERFFATFRSRFVTEVKARGRPPEDLAELNRLLWAWLARGYHQRPHSETGERPAERYARLRPRYGTEAELTEAFLWHERRKVGPKVPLVTLHGNTYEVDEALRGHEVTLYFDPHELTRVEVRLGERRFGYGKPHVISRHAHPRAGAPQPPERKPAPNTGIDYLELLEREHRRHQRPIDYRRVIGEDAGERDGHHDNQKDQR